MSKSDFSRAELRAEAVLKHRGISVLPVDPFRIAGDEGILCEEFKGAAPGISGCLMKVGDTFGIFYSNRFFSEGFRRFTVAHELGHYFLEGHFDYLFLGGNVRHESVSGFISDEHYEREADAFAAALLMPTVLFDKICAQVKPGLPAIEALAVQCATSLTATAIRYAKVCADAIAVICSKDNRVEFAFMSEILKARRGMTWVKKNSGIPESTATSRFNKDPRNMVLDRDE